MAHLKEGDVAPHFAGKDQNGNVISLDKLKGKKVILYFYPKDNTLGCTAEACDLRDHYTGLRGKKSMYGKEYEGILRKTFVIDEKGIIVKIFEKVDTKNHTEQILDALKY